MNLSLKLRFQQFQPIPVPFQFLKLIGPRGTGGQGGGPKCLGVSESQWAQVGPMGPSWWAHPLGPWVALSPEETLVLILFWRRLAEV